MRARPRRGVHVASVLFVLVASHGLLDAFTNGGDGIMILWPFDETRVFWYFRPIAVAPLRISDFLTAWGWNVIRSEMRWVWAPAAAVAFAAEALRRLARGAGRPSRA